MDTTEPNATSDQPDRDSATPANTVAVFDTRRIDRAAQETLTDCGYEPCAVRGPAEVWNLPARPAGYLDVENGLLDLHGTTIVLDKLHEQALATACKRQGIDPERRWAYDNGLDLDAAETEYRTLIRGAITAARPADWSTPPQTPAARGAATKPDLHEVAEAVRDVKKSLRTNVYGVLPHAHDRRADHLAAILEHLAAAAPDLLGLNYQTQALVRRLEATAREARGYASEVDPYRTDPADFEDLYDYPM